MKSTSGALGSLVLAILLVFCLFLIATESFAATKGTDTELVPQDGKVEVVYPVENLTSYRERRGPWATIFAVSLDQVLPNKYRSQINNDPYVALFGSTPINLVQAQLGMKYNFALGGIGASLIYGVGEVGDSHGHGGDADQLKVAKAGASVHFVMDNLFSEPYLAPYIEGQYVNFSWDESRLNKTSQTGTTDFGGVLSVGVLIQLNAIDASSSLEAQNSIGLNNTFLDIYMSQYNISASAKNPSFETDMNYGAGLRFEF